MNVNKDFDERCKGFGTDTVVELLEMLRDHYAGGSAPMSDEESRKVALLLDRMAELRAETGVDDDQKVVVYEGGKVVYEGRFGSYVGYLGDWYLLADCEDADVLMVVAY